MSEKRNDDYIVPMPGQSHELKQAASDTASQRPSSQHSDRAARPASGLSNSPSASILGYCLASISMTVVNKYIVSGSDWNLMFLYLAIQVCRLSMDVHAHSLRLMLNPSQSIVCIIAVLACQQMGLLTLERFDVEQAKKCTSCGHQGS